MTVEATTPTSVYLYRDEFGVLIYVGITSRGVRRQVEHNRDKHWWPLVGSQSVEHYDSREKAARREVELIERYAPAFNTQHNRSARVAEANYMTFRSLVDTSDAFTIARTLDRKLPIRCVSMDEGNAEYHTDVRYPALSRALVMDRAKVTITDANNAPIGRLLGIDIDGTSAVLLANVRRTAKASTGFVRLSPLPLVKRLGQQVGIRSVSLAWNFRDEAL